MAKSKYDIGLPSPEEALRFRMEQYGWTQSKFAKKLGMQPSHLSEVLNGKRRLPMEAMRKAIKLGVPAVCLFQKFKAEKSKTP